MNRLELESEIIKEGKKRNIIVTNCPIYDRGDYLEFYPTIKNETSKNWVNKYQVENLIDDLAPIERPHKIGGIRLAIRNFKVGDIVEIDNIWLRLDAGKKAPEELIKERGGCGQYIGGWVTGEVVETPEINGRALVLKFSMDIYYEEKHEWWGDVEGLEKGIREGKIRKIEKGQPLYIGTQRWELRKK